MTMNDETSARKLHCTDDAAREPDVINYSDVHRHNPKKVIAFTAPAASAPHPSMRSRPRRMERRRALQYKLLVTVPRCACVLLLTLFFYLRLALFPVDAPAGLLALWCSAYLLAGFSFLGKQYLSKNQNHRPLQ